MSDKHRKPVQGEPFKPSASRDRWLIESAERVDELQRLIESGATGDTSPSVIQVKNATGADRGRFELVGLEAPVFNPATAAQKNRALETPTFNGVDPLGYAAAFGVFIRPVPAGKVGPALVSGVTWARLYVECATAACEFAVPDGPDRLVTATDGGAYILWREGGEGEQWAFVRIGNPTADPDCGVECSGSSSGGSSGLSSGATGSQGSGSATQGSGSGGSGGSDGGGSGSLTSGGGSGSGGVSGSSGSGLGSGGSGSGSGGTGSGGSSSGGSNKSTAIVPAAWSPTGYTALFISEAPEVRFDDVIVATIPQADGAVPIDPRFIAVCEAGTLEVCGSSTDRPAVLAARVAGDHVRLEFADQRPDQELRVVLRLTGIRRGFAGHRFPDRSRAQFDANERFIRSAYPDE